MELIGYMGQVATILSLFGDSVHLGTRQVHGLRQMYHRLGNLFRGHPTVVLVDIGQVEARFDQFGDSVNLDTR